MTYPLPFDSTVDWLYVDFNSFFASVEQQLHPELRGKPIAVVPVVADSTSCIAASYPAKKYGVKTGTRVSDARKMCPGIQFIVGGHKAYVEYHHRLIECIETCIPVAVVASIDEIGAKLMGRERQVENARAIAQKIKTTIAEKVGECLTSSIGLAPNRYLAKVAADMQKPDGLTSITLEELPQKLFSLKLMDFPGVGPRMKTRLNAHGIFTTEDFLTRDKEALHRVWGGVMGEYMHGWIHGRDYEMGETERSSLSHSHVLSPEFRSHDGAAKVLRKLLHKLGTRLRKINYWARHMGVHVRFLGNEKWGEELSFIECQDDQTLAEAFDSIYQNYPRNSRQTPLKVSIWLSELVPDSMHSFSFFENPRRQKLSTTLDKINAKYGAYTIYFGGVHGAKVSAPTRIAFTNIPEFDA